MALSILLKALALSPMVLGMAAAASAQDQPVVSAHEQKEPIPINRETLADATEAILTQCALEGWQVRLEGRPNGFVRVELSPTLGDQAPGCVEEVLRNWKLPIDETVTPSTAPPGP